MAEQECKISIAIPAREELTGVLRLATTAIANRAGLDLDQSDDINTAVEEVFRYFCTSCIIDGTDISISFSIDDNKLEISAGSSFSSLSEDQTKIGRYCSFILEKVTDGYREQSSQGRHSIIIEKQIGSG